ncbi:DUF1476 family protein [Rhizobium sp. XQZ8]|nr:ATPase inhibitor subunit zeta [Rhizobium populisoli]MBW6419904.1 DUF1476 family protein [Rhizobium populisoli]
MNRPFSSVRNHAATSFWAASLIGVADAGAYAKDLVFSTLDDKAAHDIASKLRHDFDVAGVTVLDDELQTKMHDLLLDVVGEMERA